METEKTHNPSAYPSKTFDSFSGKMNGFQEGMSLRDYLAAKAMNALYSSKTPTAFSDADLQNDAIYFYKIADAMLKERLKTN